MGFFSRCFGSGCCKYFMHARFKFTCVYGVWLLGGSISEIWPHICQAWPAPPYPHFPNAPPSMSRLLLFFGYNRASPIIKHSLNLMPDAQVCVYLTVHITKLQLQSTFPKPLYIPHSACIHGTLAAENLDVCSACDPWDTNTQLTMVKDGRPGAGHAFPRQQHMRRRGGYLFLPGFSSLYDAIHGWMTRRMDGKSFMTTMSSITMSFIICNASFNRWRVWFLVVPFLLVAHLFWAVCLPALLVSLCCVLNLLAQPLLFCLWTT